MNPVDWNSLDWILASIGLFCLLRGIWRGGVSQIFGIGGGLGGFWLASHFHEDLSKQVQQSFPDISSPQMLSFSLLFFLTWFCLGCLGFWLNHLLRSGGLGSLDRALGGGVGLVKAIVLSVILLSFITFFFPPRSPVLTRSRLAPYVQGMARFLVKITPASLQKKFETKQEELKRYWAEQEEPVAAQVSKEKKQTGK